MTGPVSEPADDRPAEFADLDRLAASGKRGLARFLGLIERDDRPAWTDALLDQAAGRPRGHVLGLTGPPGVGKSTLTRCLIAHYRGIGDSVAVAAVDPSSRISGGALLGDRARMKSDPEDRQLFIRSLAARDRLGGLSDHAIAVTVLLRALFDRVIVETVGVGQSEADVTTIADSVLLCVQPGSGDSLQFMKAGIMEVPDVVAVTKADIGAAARRARSDVEGALSLAASPGPGARVPVILVSSSTGEGLGDLTEAIEMHRRSCRDNGALAKRRAEQTVHWVREAIAQSFGRDGLARTDPHALVSTANGPFQAIREAAKTVFSERTG